MKESKNKSKKVKKVIRGKKEETKYEFQTGQSDKQTKRRKSDGPTSFCFICRIHHFFLSYPVFCCEHFSVMRIRKRNTRS